jgi:hypothetical protein
LPVTHPSGVHTATCVLMGGVLVHRYRAPRVSRCSTPYV